MVKKEKKSTRLMGKSSHKLRPSRTWRLPLPFPRQSSLFHRPKKTTMVKKKKKKSTRLIDESSHKLRPRKTSRAAAVAGGGQAAAGGGQEKKLYVFLSHSAGWAHSLYVLDVPSTEGNDDVTPPCPSVTTTTVTTTVTTTDDSSSISTTQTRRIIDGVLEKDRSTVESVLEFESTAWPAGMSFSTLGRKLYFVGGFSGDSLKNRTYHRKVFVLDLDTVSSTTEFSSYRHRPAQILKPGPPMMSGKIDPISFICDGHIFLLSARVECPHSQYRIHAPFERLGGIGENEWEVLASPNFPSYFRLSAHVQVNRRVIVSGFVKNKYRLYSYDLDNNQWSEFDTTGWTRVEKGYKDLGFILSSGSTFIRGGIYGVFRSNRGAIPLLMRLEKQEEGGGLLLSKDGMYDVIKYKLLSPDISSTLATLGEDNMCFLQVGNPPAEIDDPTDFNSAETHMSISVFNVHPPWFLGSAHYVTYPGRDFTIVDAYFV